MNPSIGRIVHYVDIRGIHNAAIITGLIEHGVRMTVFASATEQPVTYRAFGENDETGHKKQTWHWPEMEG